MKKSFLVSGLLVLILLVPVTLILSWNSPFGRINVAERAKLNGKTKININEEVDKEEVNKEEVDKEEGDTVVECVEYVEYIVIDRFEGNFAVCENEKGEMVNIDRSKLPKEAKEGHVLKMVGEKFEIDYDKTEKRKNRNLKLIESLFS